MSFSYRLELAEANCVRGGEAGVVGDDHRRLTGKEPMSIGEVVTLHRYETPLASR